MKRSRKDKSYVSRQNADLKYLQVQLGHQVRWVSIGNWRAPLPLASSAVIKAGAFQRLVVIPNQPDQYRATIMIATTRNAAISESARSSAFLIRALRCVGWRHGLSLGLQFADEPANISGLHRIWRYNDCFDMIAFGAVERAKFASCGTTRNPNFDLNRRASPRPYR